MGYFDNLSQSQQQNALLSLIAAGGGMMANARQGLGASMAGGVQAGLNQYERGLTWATRKQERQEDKEYQKIRDQQSHARQLERDYQAHKRALDLKDYLGEGDKVTRDYYTARTNTLNKAMEQIGKPKQMTEKQEIDTDIARLTLKEKLRMEQLWEQGLKDKEAQRIAEEAEENAPGIVDKIKDFFTSSEAEKAVEKAINGPPDNPVERAKEVLRQGVSTAAPGGLSPYTLESMGVAPRSDPGVPSMSPGSFIREALSSDPSLPGVLEDTYQGGFLSGDKDPGSKSPILDFLINPGGASPVLEGPGWGNEPPPKGMMYRKKGSTEEWTHPGFKPRQPSKGAMEDYPEWLREALKGYMSGPTLFRPDHWGERD